MNISPLNNTGIQSGQFSDLVGKIAEKAQHVDESGLQKKVTDPLIPVLDGPSLSIDAENVAVAATNQRTIAADDEKALIRDYDQGNPPVPPQDLPGSDGVTLV